MVMKNCRMCKHTVFSLDLNAKTVFCKNCEKHISMAYDQLTKCIKYYHHLNMEEIANELGISRTMMLILEETGRLQAIEAQFQQQAQAKQAANQAVKKDAHVNRNMIERQRQHQLKKQLLSSMKPKHA